MLRNLLEETGALVKGHFILSSGKHTDTYIQCAKLLQYPDKAEKFLRPLANKIKDLGADMLVGPAMGGIVVAYELGRQLGLPAIFVERENGIMKLRRGFEIPQGSKVIITEDVVTTGKSSMEAVDVVKEAGGRVIAIASLIDRTSDELDYPLYSVEKFDIEVLDPEDCPLCKEGSIPIKPGSRSL